MGVRHSSIVREEQGWNPADWESAGYFQLREEEGGRTALFVPLLRCCVAALEARPGASRPVLPEPLDLDFRLRQPSARPPGREALLLTRQQKAPSERGFVRRASSKKSQEFQEVRD